MWNSKYYRGCTNLLTLLPLEDFVFFSPISPWIYQPRSQTFNQVISFKSSINVWPGFNLYLAWCHLCARLVVWKMETIAIHVAITIITSLFVLLLSAVWFQICFHFYSLLYSHRRFWDEQRRGSYTSHLNRPHCCQLPSQHQSISKSHRIMQGMLVHFERPETK